MRSVFLEILLCICITLLAAGAVIGADRPNSNDEPYNKPVLRGEKFPGQELLGEEILDPCQTWLYAGDTMKVLAILAEWTDCPGAFSPETYYTHLFSRGVLPEGSLAEYFDEVSYGKLTIIGDVEGWFNVGENFERYDSWDWDQIVADLDPYIDFSQYNANGDDSVDAIMIIQSQYLSWECESGIGVGGFAWLRLGPWALGPFDGVMANRLCTGAGKRTLRNPDNLFEFTGVDTVTRIRTFCHELSHNLALPDLYDYDSSPSGDAFSKPHDHNDFPMVDWCLMDGTTGGNAFAIDMVRHLCGWSKMKLHWIEPIVLEGEFEDLVICNIESHDDSALYLLPITPSEGEYFLLEYRNPYGSHMFGKYGADMSYAFYPDMDFGPELLDRGLQITHVHDSLFGGFCGSSNDGFPDYPNYMVAVKDAGYDPDRDYTYNPEGRLTDSSQWWYPYEARRGALFSDNVEGQSEFGPETTPSSDGYFGPSNIYVRVDSIVGNRLYAYVNTDYTGPSYVCGDANGDGAVSQLDVAFLIEYLHKDGPAPDPMEAGDANGDGTVDKDDAKYLIEYLHKDGPEPVCP